MNFHWGNCHNLNFKNRDIYLWPLHQIHQPQPQHPNSHFLFTSISIILHQFQNSKLWHTSISFPFTNEMDQITVKKFPATFSTTLHSTPERIPFLPLLLNPHRRNKNGCTSQHQFILNTILHFIPLASEDSASNRLQNGIWVHILSHTTTITSCRQSLVIGWTGNFRPLTLIRR